MQDQVQTLAAVIREARVRARLSMRELARRSGSRLRRSAGSRPARSNAPLRDARKTREGPRSGCAAASCFRGTYSRGEGAAAPTGDRVAARAEQSRARSCAFAARRGRPGGRLGDELAEREGADRDSAGSGRDPRTRGSRADAQSSRAVARGRDLARQRALDIAQKRRRLEQLEDAPSEEICALAGALPGHGRWRRGARGLAEVTQVRSRLTIRSFVSCSRRGVSSGTNDAKCSSSPRSSWLSRCSGPRRPSSDSPDPRGGIRDVRNLRPGRPRTEDRPPFAVGQGTVFEIKERQVMAMQGTRRGTAVDRLALTGTGLSFRTSRA